MSYAASMVARLHVSTRNRDVVRYIRSRIAKKHRRDPSKRDARKAFYRDALKAHAAHQELYAFVHRGCSRD